MMSWPARPRARDWSRAFALTIACAALAGCDVEPDLGLYDAADDALGSGPGCPTNWVPVREESLVAGHARVTGGALVLGPGAAEVEVRALLGGQPVEKRRFVLRLELTGVALGPDGKLEIGLVSPVGPLASLIVQNAGAVLMTEAFPVGQLVEIPLRVPPERVVVELESRPDLSVAIRAFLGPAADGKVLALEVARFDGGMVTPTITLWGTTSEVRLDRYSKVDPTGGVADDFSCDTLGTAFDRDRWPAGRVPNAGGSCTHDFACGPGERCVDAVCRTTCLASGECPGSICLVRPEGGTCRLPGEADCDTAPADLVCGPDDTARIGCTTRLECPGPDDLCIGGACVANDESAGEDGARWGTCAAADTRCQGDVVQVCDLGGPGWNALETCPAGECLDEIAGARCDDCVSVCQGEDVFERCGGATDFTLAVDCREAFEACSTGDDQRERPHCRAFVAAEPPSKVVTAGGIDIDPTEVTRAQYLAFLQTRPDPKLQPPACAWNTSFAPPDGPWFTSPRRAVMVDHCDAEAYCAWAGKRLCGAPTGGPVTATMLGDASTDGWFAVCTAGGQLDFPYGDVYQAGVCSDDPRRDVGSSPGCTSAVPGYTGVFDMIGGVGEWIDACVPGSGATPDADSCRTRGTSASEPCRAMRTMRRDSQAGFRCCAAP